MNRFVILRKHVNHVKGGEIRAVMFNAAVDKFYDLLQEGNVYIIAKGTLKHANKQFSAGIKNGLEISLGENSIVQLVEDDKSVCILFRDLLV